jgi:DNA invertase Pin-like site-specific DNA recombinase
MGSAPHEGRVVVSPEKKPTKPVDIYVRVSQVRGREGDSFQSPKQQEDRCRAQLQADGLKPDKVFIDLDQSGGKASRPAFDKAMARIAEGVSGGMVVYDLSRFGRNTRNVLDGIDFIESHGGVFVSCAEKIDTSTSTGRFVLTVFAALREMEREQVKERWLVSQANAKAKGKHIGVARAGYRRDEVGRLVEVAEDMAAVKQAFALRARGASWGETARMLSESGLRTWRGRETWSPAAVESLISNRSYREPEGPVAAWQWDRAQARKDGTRAPRGEYVLGRGLVKCGHCEGSMVKTTSKGVPMLRCMEPGKGHAAVKYETVADYLLSRAFSHLGVRKRSRQGADIETLQAAVSEAREALAAAEEMVGVALPPDSKQRRALDEAEAALSEAMAETETPLDVSDLLTPVGVRAEFEKLDLPEQRRLLRQIIEKVTLKPGREHIAERLDIVFTDGTVWPPPYDPKMVPVIEEAA